MRYEVVNTYMVESLEDGDVRDYWVVLCLQDNKNYQAKQRIVKKGSNVFNTLLGGRGSIVRGTGS